MKEIQPGTSRLSVVVVKNDSHMNELLTLVLSSAGYQVQCFNDGCAILDSTLQQPDLYIIDRNIPTIDGLALLKYLRIQQRSKAIPVLFLSTTKIERRALDAGANAFLPKPFAVKDILNEVEKLTVKKVVTYENTVR